MATITKKQFRARQYAQSAGNLSVLAFLAITAASGALAESDSAAAVAAGDVLDLGPLPAGMRLDDSITRVSTAWTAAVTGSLGFKYEDGVDDATVPQDAAYFGAGIALNAAGLYRASGGKAPVTLPKPARLILTIAGAANAKASRTDISVIGEQLGNP